jgi:hypothetical protein
MESLYLSGLIKKKINQKYLNLNLDMYYIRCHMLYMMRMKKNKVTVRKPIPIFSKSRPHTDKKKLFLEN